MYWRTPVACLALLALGAFSAAPAFAQSGSAPVASSAPASSSASPQSSAAPAQSSRTQSPAATQRDTPAPALVILPGAELPPLKPPAPAVPPTPPAPARVQVTVPSGTRIAVVLDTPVSTRISHTGQIISFRTSEPLYLDGKLVLPSDSVMNGKVIEVHKPGLFTSSGNIQMSVDALQQPDGSEMPVATKLEATDSQASGKGKSDKSKTATLLSIALMAGEGAAIGSLGGARGAAIGAGAGAAIAMAGTMTKHGQDVDLEPGTPFLVTLNQPVLMWAIVPQPNAASSAPGPSSAAPSDPRTDPDRPQLEHRPKPQSQPVPPLN